MTIKDVIDKVAKLKAHPYDDAIIIQWLSDLDRLIWHEVLSWHETDIMEPEAYSAENTNTKLLVPEPYSELYIFYVCAKIDFYQREYNSYNNDMMMYNTAYSTFADWFNRNNMPKQNYYFKI